MHVGRAVGFITVGFGTFLAVAPSLWPQLNYLIAYVGLALMVVGALYLIWALAVPKKAERESKPGPGFRVQAYAVVRPSKAVQVMCAELADAIQREWDSDHTSPQFEEHRKRLREQIKPRVEAFHVWTRELESLSKQKNWDRTVALKAKSELRSLVSPPEPIVITPEPAVIHIDRTPSQMAQFLFNRNPLVRRVRKTWWRLKHGL
jgi:hypothetical protein